MTSLAAVILAGGRASRLDGADKPLLELGGRTLLDRMLGAVRAVGAAPVVVVGPPSVARTDTVLVREDPPFSGPAAAVVAALGALDPAHDPAWTLLLAVDLEDAAGAVATLVHELDRLDERVDGRALVDQAGTPQRLTGVYRTAALRRVAAEMPDAARDASIRRLLEPLTVTLVPAAGPLVHDIDTWDDLRQARSRQAQQAPDDDGGPHG